MSSGSKPFFVNTVRAVWSYFSDDTDLAVDDVIFNLIALFLPREERQQREDPLQRWWCARVDSNAAASGRRRVSSLSRC